MIQAIEISIPVVDPDFMEGLQEREERAVASELEALELIREKYGPLCRLAGPIKIASLRHGPLERKEVYYELCGEQVRGLRIIDLFNDPADARRLGGVFNGSRLYLLPSGWLELKRVGRYSSNAAVEPSWWATSSASMLTMAHGVTAPIASAATGTIALLSSAQVLKEYGLIDVLKGLGTAVRDLIQRAVTRDTQARTRIKLAEKIAQALAAE